MEKTANTAPYSNQKNYVYLDHNATTPMAEKIILQASEFLGRWGNPSSIHWAGRGPKTLLREAKKKISNYLNVHPLELILTSGGSESNNLAIKGVYDHYRAKDFERNHYVCSQVEHPSVLKTFEYLAELGANVSYISVNQNGEIDLEELKNLITEKTALVSVMYANNETGHIFPIKEIAELAHEKGAFFHSDAVQSLGKTEVDVKSWNVDLCSFSAHKVYAPKGCGLLYMRKGLKLNPLIHGGAQERGRRAGTENVWPLISLSQILTEETDLSGKIETMRVCRDHMENLILEKIENVKITGQSGQRLPNTSSLVLDGVNGESLLMSLDVKGFAVSTGAACSSGSPEPSPTLLNMGLSREQAQSSLRLSLGWSTSKAEVENFVESLVQVVERLRSYDE